jgi:REP element-mobilizing transposase RayT
MSRLPRYVLPGQPHQVIRRGNNRSPTFFTDGDYCFYLQCLEIAAERQDCAIHAYVLMTQVCLRHTEKNALCCCATIGGLRKQC